MFSKEKIFKKIELHEVEANAPSHTTLFEGVVYFCSFELHIPQFLYFFIQNLFSRFERNSENQSRAILILPLIIIVPIVLSRKQNVHGRQSNE